MMRVYRQKTWVVTTGKGEVYIVLAHSPGTAVTRLQIEYAGLAVASIIEARAVL